MCRGAEGRFQDMACRTMLQELERAGQITLPRPRAPANNHIRSGSIPHVCAKGLRSNGLCARSCPSMKCWLRPRPPSALCESGLPILLPGRHGPGRRGDDLPKVGPPSGARACLRFDSGACNVSRTVTLPDGDLRGRGPVSGAAGTRRVLWGKIAGRQWSGSEE